MRSLLIIILSCIYTICNSQGINNLWLMGYAGGGGPFTIEFSSGTMNVISTNRPMNMATTNANIADNNGNLLFCSNGIYIMSWNNDTMMNGSGLNPADYTTTYFNNGLYLPQGNLILPFPDDSSKYYLFHVTLDQKFPVFAPFNLYYSIVDMTMNNGHGSVLQKNIVLVSDTFEIGELTAVRHANGRDWWMVNHTFNSNQYNIFLISPTGITQYTQFIGTIRNFDWPGQSVFSPDGSKFAHYNPNTDVDILDFDRCNGTFSNPINISINDSAGSFGIAISPNSQLLYVSSMNYVYQFDLTDTNIASTKTTIAVWDSTYSPFPPFATRFYLAQLAPDNKIYIICSNSTVDIHVINHPDSVGLFCDLQQHSVALPAYNAFTIPNHPNYFLGNLPNSPCDSLTSIAQHSGKDEGVLYLAYRPDMGKLFVNAEGIQGGEAQLEVWDMNSKLVYSHRKAATPPYYTQDVNVSSLGAGLYIVSLTTEKESLRGKFVKQ